MRAADQGQRVARTVGSQGLGGSAPWSWHARSRRSPGSKVHKTAKGDQKEANKTAKADQKQADKSAKAEQNKANKLAEADQ